MKNILDKIDFLTQFILETAPKTEKLRVIFELVQNNPNENTKKLKKNNQRKNFDGVQLIETKEKLLVIYNEINEIYFLENNHQAIIFSTKEKIVAALKIEGVIQAFIINHDKWFDTLMESKFWGN